MMKYEIGHVLKQKAAGKEHIYILTGTFQTVNRHGFDADVLVWTGQLRNLRLRVRGHRQQERTPTSDAELHRSPAKWRSSAVNCRTKNP